MSISQGKARKVLSESFVENNKDVNEDRAMELIFLAEQKIKNLKEEQASDDKLNAAVSIAKDLKAGYSSALSYERAKISFLIEQIEEIQAVESGSGEQKFDAQY